MQVDINDFVLSQRKVNGKEVVEKIVSAIPEPLSDKTVQISPVGGEIHSGESLVDRVGESETLAQKIARFDRLAQTVVQNRAYMLHMAQEMMGDDGEPDDIYGDEFDDVDPFGDIIEKSSEKPDGVASANESAAPTAGPTEEQEAEPSGDAD